jgi:adenine deaminase
MQSFTISGQLIDLFERNIYPAIITIEQGRITGIQKTDTAPAQYLLPGFIDAHVHIESSMLVPATFARLAVIHGTVATISDPHEIANVCGMQGIQYMIGNSKQTPFKIFFGAPSCVPATSFETAGAAIDATVVEELLKSNDIWYLSEMMNYPGVLNGDAQVMAKIKAAKKAGKPVDGHAPGLKGEEAAAYANAGITTDHECFTLDEAMHKIRQGMHIIIREGSAAKNYEALCELIKLHPDKIMFCSDDKHPDELVLGHINELVKRSLAKKYDLYDVLRAACVNPAEHYNIPVGLLRVNDPADLIVIDNLNDFNILQTYINGELVAEQGKTLLPYIETKTINNFNAGRKEIPDLAVKTDKDTARIRVIEALEGQLITHELYHDAKIRNGYVVSDVENDILKIAVINRYENVPIATAFIKNFGLKKGALASTIAHDCHNIIAVGADDTSICAAVNALIDHKGGIAVAAGENDVHILPLPVAGLMSTEDGYEVAAKYSALDKKAKELGTNLRAPFMTLSFMALLVIPALKLSDKGLFDGSDFKFTSLYV